MAAGQSADSPPSWLAALPPLRRAMMSRVFRRIALLPLLANTADAGQIRVATFNIGATFGETFFIHSLGDPGTPDHDTVRDILARIDADVVALQEIHSVDLQGSPNDLQALAGYLGYDYLNVPPVTGVFDNTLRVVLLSRFPLLQSSSIAPPAGARDMTRRHAVVQVDLPGTHADPFLVSPHLKAGTASGERFQRAVEMRRLVNHLAAEGIGGNHNFVVLGDFNPSATQTTFTELPTGLPQSFVLGNDIPFPVTYFVNPVDYFPDPVFRLDARQPGGSAVTFDTSTGGRTLDLILVSPAIAARDHASEIYNSALDVSNAVGLPKAGAPLAAGTSAAASDHYAVFADLRILPNGPYAFRQPGEAVSENFGAITGLSAPPPWNATAGGAWTGLDDGTSSQRGWRVYGGPGAAAPGFLSNGQPASLSATFENLSPVPLTALEISLDAKQWSAASGGAADSLTVELVTPRQILPLADLTFTADTTLPTGPLAGGAPVFLTTIARNLWIEPGASFDLRVSFRPDPESAPPPAAAFINEFHYDNSGGDTGEFVEVVVGPGFTGDLAALSLRLYNGSNGAEYAAHALNTFEAGETTASGHRIYYKMISDIQNGAPDGLALVDGSSVLQFLSYEGAFTAISGPAAGLVSKDIGVSQGGTRTAGEAALGLTGTGGSADGFSWVEFIAIPHSPGAANHGQAFIVPGKTAQGLAFDNLNVAHLPDNDLDGEPDSTDADDDNDGQSDAYETAFGSNPKDRHSRFDPVIVRTAAGVGLSFPGVRGIDYTVEASTGLDLWQELVTVAGADETIAIPLPMAEPAMFFRLKSQGPNH